MNKKKSKFKKKNTLTLFPYKLLWLKMSLLDYIFSVSRLHTISLTHMTAMEI